MSVKAEMAPSASKITAKGLIKAENSRFTADSRLPQVRRFVPQASRERRASSGVRPSPGVPYCFRISASSWAAAQYRRSRMASVRTIRSVRRAVASFFLVFFMVLYLQT